MIVLSLLSGSCGALVKNSDFVRGIKFICKTIFFFTNVIQKSVAMNLAVRLDLSLACSSHSLNHFSLACR